MSTSSRALLKGAGTIPESPGEHSESQA